MPSTHATRRIQGTDRSTPTHSRRSTARNNTRGQPTTRPIRVHRRAHPISDQQPCLRRTSTPGWPQDWARGWWVTRGAGVPPRRRQRRSRPGVVQRMRCSTPLPLAYSGTSPPTRRDTRFPPPVLRQANTRRAVRVLLGTVNSGHQRCTEVHATSRSACLTWHGRQISKLPTKHRRLRRASLRDGSRTSPG
jgi:hypothetical protein